MNKRKMKCGKQVTVIGAEDSFADSIEKQSACKQCLVMDCKHREQYLKLEAA